MDGGYPAGGSAELAELIDEHGESLVADLKRFYGVELSDVLVPGSGLSARRVLAYVRSLPLDSATVASLRGGDQFRQWDLHSYLLASVIDSINQNTYVLLSANSKRKPKPIPPVERPAQKVKANPLTSKFAAMARMARNSAVKRKKA